MNLRIETLRGLACLLLVFYHVVGADPSNGLRVLDGPVRWTNDTLAYLRMPLFTFLSGLVYGMRPFSGQASDSQQFLLGKCRRLLIPMLVVGTLFALLQAAVPGTNRSIKNWGHLHWEPVAHFWFVESLFWVFLLVWAGERLSCFKSRQGVWFACLGAAAVTAWAPGGWYVLSIEGAFYLLPYFMFGMAISRRNWWFVFELPWVQVLLILVVVCSAWQLGAPVPGMNRRTPGVLLLGLALCSLCLATRIELRWLARIGTASYAIYLFHVFFTAATRIGLNYLHVDSMALKIVLGVSVGVFGPMLINNLASPYRWPALLLLGKTAKSKAISKPMAV
jgi:peptidoglycan/LPS O-acetylase OafA/YrhL